MTEDEKIATIEAASSLDVPFRVTRKDAGTYSVNIDGLTGSFTVREVAVLPPAPPPGINWTIWRPVIIGVAVFLAIFLPIRMRRRLLG